MTGFAIVGMVVIVAIIAAGVWWLAENITFKRMPERYRYEEDYEENPVVHDMTEKKVDNEKT